MIDYVAMPALPGRNTIAAALLVVRLRAVSLPIDVRLFVHAVNGVLPRIHR